MERILHVKENFPHFQERVLRRLFYEHFSLGSPSRSINICFKCSINVNQLREHAKQHPLSTYQVITFYFLKKKQNVLICKIS